MSLVCLCVAFLCQIMLLEKEFVNNWIFVTFLTNQFTLEPGINIALRLLIFEKNSRGYTVLLRTLKTLNTFEFQVP